MNKGTIPQILLISFILNFISCGRLTDNGKNSKEIPFRESAPATVDFQLQNARKHSDRIFLDSFRDRENYTYEQGIASVMIPTRTTLKMNEDDIKVYYKIDESDFNRVDGYNLHPSEQPWAFMKFVSQTSGEVVKICVQVQPHNQFINSFGEVEFSLIRKDIYTVLDDRIKCEELQVDNINVFEGLLEQYFVVDNQTKIHAETKNDLKAKKSKNNTQRIGLKVEFSFTIIE